MSEIGADTQLTEALERAVNEINRRESAASLPHITDRHGYYLVRIERHKVAGNPR